MRESGDLHALEGPGVWMCGMHERILRLDWVRASTKALVSTCTVYMRESGDLHALEGPGVWMYGMHERILRPKARLEILAHHQYIYIISACIMSSDAALEGNL